MVKICVFIGRFIAYCLECADKTYKKEEEEKILGVPKGAFNEWLYGVQEGSEER